MSEHYTANTESATRHCNTCGRRTQHGVSAGRIGRCLEHQAEGLSKKQIENRERLARLARQAQAPGLFS